MEHYSNIYNYNCVGQQYDRYTQASDWPQCGYYPQQQEAGSWQQGYSAQQPCWQPQQESQNCNPAADSWAEYYAQTQPNEKPNAETEPEEACRMTATRAKWINRILNIVTYGMCGIMVVGTILFSFSNKEDKSLFGYRFYNVLTPSMAPVFNPGDMIFVQLCPVEKLQPEDIVTFLPSSQSSAYLTHRLKELVTDEDGNITKIITKGDANTPNDPPVAADNVVGKYLFRIPAVGDIIAFVRGNLLLVGVIIVSCFLLLVVLRSYFSAQKRAREDMLLEEEDLLSTNSLPPPMEPTQAWAGQPPYYWQST